MKAFAMLISILVTAGCSAINVAQYSENKPRLDLFQYFEGETKGWGIVQDRSGRLTRQFVVEIRGTIDAGGRLVLEEHFNWSDGEKSSRTWTIEKSDDHTFAGTAGDVVGTAEGKAYGNALNWRYKLLLEVDGSSWKVNFDDWMFLQPDNVLINRAAMSKFGLHVGDVTIVFKK